MLSKVFKVIILVFSIQIYVSSQTKFEEEKVSEMLEKYINSIEKNWIYFKLEDTLIVKVIEHNSAGVGCGFFGATASITVVETSNNDTIRIIDMCNSPYKQINGQFVEQNYLKGQFVKIIPADKPNIFVSKPYNWDLNPMTNTKELSGYDLSIQKTAWGTIINLE